MNMENVDSEGKCTFKSLYSYSGNKKTTRTHIKLYLVVLMYH